MRDGGRQSPMGKIRLIAAQTTVVFMPAVLNMKISGVPMTMALP